MAAVMCEDVARTVHFARQLGPTLPISDDDIGRLYDRYQNVYGQQPATTPETTGLCPERTAIVQTAGDTEIWFLTGSQSLYGDDTLQQVADQSQEIARTLDAADGIPVRIVWKPVLTTADAIRRTCRDASASDSCVGVIAWMHTFSPAKMWISGLDALRKPLLHLHTQANVSLPWSEIDMDFMNLNQAAHGDREFGYLQTRMGVTRKIVAGHSTDPAVAAGSGRGARRHRLARVPVVAAGPVRRQHARRRRDRGRQGRGADPARRLGQHVRRERPRGCRRLGRRPGRRCARRRVRGLVQGGRRAAPGRGATRVPAVRRADRAGTAELPHRWWLYRVHDELPGPRRAPSSPGSLCSG